MIHGFFSNENICKVYHNLIMENYGYDSVSHELILTYTYLNNKHTKRDCYWFTLHFFLDFLLV